MSEIKKVILDREVIYLKKKYFWSVIYPWKNEDGTINWWNFTTGGTPNLLRTIFLLFLIGVFFLAYKESVSNYTNLILYVKEICPIAFTKVDVTQLNNLNITLTP